MTEEKGLDATVADKIGEYVKLKGKRSQYFKLPCPSLSAGGLDLLDQLLKDAALSGNATAKVGLDEMTTLFTLLKAFGVLDKVIPSLSCK